jgi:hypothetical protein
LSIFHPSVTNNGEMGAAGADTRGATGLLSRFNVSVPAARCFPPANAFLMPLIPFGLEIAAR